MCIYKSALLIDMNPDYNWRNKKCVRVCAKYQDTIFAQRHIWLAAMFVDVDGCTLSHSSELLFIEFFPPRHCILFRSAFAPLFKVLYEIAFTKQNKKSCVRNTNDSFKNESFCIY